MSAKAGASARGHLVVVDDDGVDAARARAAASASWSLVPQSPVTITRQPSSAKRSTSAGAEAIPASRLATRGITVPPSARSALASAPPRW